MRTVHQTQPQIQILLSAPDYVAALELIVTSQDILDHELAGIHCFKHLGHQLSEISLLIDKMMASEFVSYSTRDLNRPLADNLEVLEQVRIVMHIKLYLNVIARSRYFDPHFNDLPYGIGF